MGRKSTKDNKNIFQQAREEAGLTRSKAEELMQFISDDRIEKIESDKTIARPEEVLAMAKCYQRADLNNYYCSHLCPIGQKYVPEIDKKELSQITLEVLDNLNSLEKVKNRLIEITVDGVISQDEKEDFIRIKDELQQMSNTIGSLSLWIEDSINKGSIE